MVTNQDNRIPASQVARKDPLKFKHSLAVGKIINKKTGVSGTAFRIGPGNHMMANAHVLTTGNPQEYRIEFTDAKGQVTRVDGDKMLAFSPESKTVNPRPDISDKKYLDFALFTINSSQFAKVQKFGYLELDVEGAKAGQEIYIPQYSRYKGRATKTIVSSDDAQGPERPSQINHVDLEANLPLSLRRGAVRYTADAEDGASGAPVISADSHKVVALHVGTIAKSFTNVGANMSSIWQEIKGVFSKTTSKIPPKTQHHVANQYDKNRQDQVGDRRTHNGTLQELWKSPSGGQRWVDVWQSKYYAVGDLVLLDGNAYAYRGDVQHGASPWAPAFDPSQQYQPNEKVYYYGRIVDAKKVMTELAHPRRGIH